jgi:hypothetical protein
MIVRRVPFPGNYHLKRGGIGFREEKVDPPKVAAEAAYVYNLSMLELEGGTSMGETILLGRGRQITRIPREEWEKHLSQAPQHSRTRLSFMSEEHHLVRYFVVRELPRTGEPIRPELISQKLSLPLARVNAILDELEKNLFFLVRNGRGAVSWAFPVTADSTPHHLTFSTGEQLYAA